MEALVLGQLSVFPSLYDPSDLPGTSVDPLGFERGYVALADVGLPGLTTVTDTPRYLSMLAAALVLSHSPTASSERPIDAERELLEKVMRFERLWALASVLSWRESGTEASAVGVLRGVSYARFQADRLQKEGRSEVEPDFRFLRRQRITGGIGIYRGLMEGAGLLFRGTWRLTPDLGEPLGRAFLESSRTPPSVRKAVIQGGGVPRNALARWGAAAEPLAAMNDEERQVLREGFIGDVRRRCTVFLAAPYYDQADHKAMALVLRCLRKKNRVAGVPVETHVEVAAALDIALRFERLYRLLLLAFERVLWLARRGPGGVRVADLAADSVVGLVRHAIPHAANSLASAVARSKALPPTARDAISDAVQAGSHCASATGTAAAFLEQLMSRHRVVQEGKFDRGRRKSPWVVREGDFYRLTLARPGGLDFEATQPKDIPMHDYRFRNAGIFARSLGLAR